MGSSRGGGSGTATTFIFLQLFSCLNSCLLSTVLQQIEPHRDVYILSDSNNEEHVPVYERFLYSTLNVTLWTDSGMNLKFWGIVGNSGHAQSQSVTDIAIIICMKSEDTTLKAIDYLGSNMEKHIGKIRSMLWIVVMWPTVMKDMGEIDAISSQQSFKNAVNYFLVNSQTFFSFDLNSEGNSSSALTYETYLAGNYTVFRHLPDGIALWNCEQCRGPSLRRFNFHERELRVTAVNDTELTDDLYVYKDDSGKVTYSTEGFSGSMLSILQQMLNFTVVASMAQGWGSPIPGTNKWDGSVGEIAEGKADIAISITIFQSNRAAVVSFLPPADEHLINAFFTPSDVENIRDIFAQPFQLDLWAAVFSTWMVLAICMIIFSIIRKRYILRQADIDEDHPEPDFTQESFIWALGTACQQGWDEHPRAGSLRAIFISGSFTGVVAYAGYSAAIVSTLSLQVDPIQNPTQLLKSNLRVGIRKGFISSILEQNNTRDTMSQFYKRLEKSKEYERYLNVSTGLQYLLRHPYAFITTRDTIYDLLKLTYDEKIICAIKDLPILKYGFPLGYPVSKTSSLKEILRYAMIMIREPGVLYRLRMKYSYKRRCLVASQNAGYALGPNDVFTAYMILLAGFALSITLLVAERMVPFHRLASFVYIK